MSGRKFHKAVSIESWMVVIFERRNIFNDTNVINLVKNLKKNLLGPMYSDNYLYKYIG